jgi:hypothetical protein
MTAPALREAQFMALTWTAEPDGTPVTILTLQGAVADVACYALQGEHSAPADWHRLLATGYKLSEAQARALGAGWPASLTYRR